MKNLDQKTYDRIIDRLRGRNDRFPRAITPKDAADLLLAYEGAVTLLERAYCEAEYDNDTDDFLYTHLTVSTKTSRVQLDTDEELTHSARGLLRPTSVDSQDDD